MSDLDPNGPAQQQCKRRHRYPSWAHAERKLEDGSFEYEVEHLSAPLIGDLVRLDPWRPTITAVNEGLIRIHFTRYRIKEAKEQIAELDKDERSGSD